MENLDGKYFERVIGELQKAKAQENFVLSSEFKSKLRADLLVRADLLMEKPGFDWNAFLYKWKYALGAVPTLALLTVVAMNFMNNKVVVKQTDFMPLVQNTGTGVLNNESVNLKTMAESTFVDVGNNVEDAGVKTFSADLAMPPADVLARYLEKSDFIGVESLPFNAFGNDNYLLDNSNDNVVYSMVEAGNLKIVKPDLQSYKFDFGNTSFGFSIVNGENLNTNKTVTFVDVKSNGNNEGKAFVDVPVQRSEQSGKVESSGMIAPAVPAAVVKPKVIANPVVEQIVPVQNESSPTVLQNTTFQNTTELKTLLIDQNAAADLTQNVKINSVLPTQLPTKDTQVLNNQVLEFIDPQVEMAKNAEETLPANLLMNQAINLPARLFTANRVKYEGEDRGQIVSLIGAVMSDQSSFAPDYYIKVEKLRSGNLKVSLFEYGSVSRVVYLSATDDFRVVTEVRQ